MSKTYTEISKEISDDLSGSLSLGWSNLAPIFSILDERERQKEKWGMQRHDWGWWAAILGEEYGEACQEMLRNHFGNKDNLSELREELIQVAAVAVAIVEHVDELIEGTPDE